MWIGELKISMGKGLCGKCLREARRYGGSLILTIEIIFSWEDTGP